MIPRGLILSKEYVERTNVKCVVCGKPAYADCYDKDWDVQPYCIDDYPIEESE